MEPQKKCPAFLKSYLADCSNRLEIHPSLTSFMKSSETVLRNYMGMRWTVGVAKIGDNMYLQANWRKFVEENYIEFGDLLVFHYNGALNILDLKNLGKMASEKHVLEAFGFNRQEEKVPQEPADDVIKETTLKSKHADMEKVDGNDRPSKGPGYMNGNPYFIVKILKNRLGEFYVLPSDLKNYHGGMNREEFMNVIDNGHEWHSEVSRKKGGCVVMKNWELIRIANGLNVGDEFVCEIVTEKEGSKPYIQVHHLNRTEEKLPQESGLGDELEWPFAHLFSHAITRRLQLYGRGLGADKEYCPDDGITAMVNPSVID